MFRGLSTQTTELNPIRNFPPWLAFEWENVDDRLGISMDLYRNPPYKLHFTSLIFWLAAQIACDIFQFDRQLSTVCQVICDKLNYNFIVRFRNCDYRPILTVCTVKYDVNLSGNPIAISPIESYVCREWNGQIWIKYQNWNSCCLQSVCHIKCGNGCLASHCVMMFTLKQFTIVSETTWILALSTAPASTQCTQNAINQRYQNASDNRLIAIGVKN